MSTPLPTIDFSHNWNNKLYCASFTTIRLRNDQKYDLHKEYDIRLKGKSIGTGVIDAIVYYRIDTLNELICRLDTGYTYTTTRDLIKKMYQARNIDWNTQQLALILIRMPQTAIRNQIPDKTAKQEPNLFNNNAA